MSKGCGHGGRGRPLLGPSGLSAMAVSLNFDRVGGFPGWFKIGGFMVKVPEPPPHWQLARGWVTGIL